MTSLLSIGLLLVSAASGQEPAPADTTSEAGIEEPSASAPGDRTHLYLRQGVAVAGWPSGLLSDSRAELRTPLYRSDSIVFQDTSAGVGARVAVTPAFVEAGPRISLAPVDVFDVDLSAGVVHYWPGKFGPLPTDQLGGTLEADRAPLVEQNVSTTGLTLQATPTLKAKVGRVIIFDAWTLRHHRLAEPEVDASDGAKPWVYEPFTDLIVGWTDTVIEHQPGLLVELIPDHGGAWLRVGGTMRDRWSVETGDRSLSAGALVAVKPGRAEAVPTIAGLALAYAIDDDRRGGVPFLGMQAAWVLRRGLSSRTSTTASQVFALTGGAPSGGA